MWVLNLADGQHSTLAIAERAVLPLSLIGRAIDLLAGHGLIDRSDSPDPEGVSRFIAEP
jgi:aminopeptidase-like protein